MRLRPRLLLLLLGAACLLAAPAPAAEPEPAESEEAEPEDEEPEKAEPEEAESEEPEPDEEPEPEAADARSFTRDGWYAGLQTAKGFEHYDNGSGLRGNDVEAWGLNARVGWRDLTYLGVEGQFEWLDGFKLRGSDVEVRVYTFTLNFKGYYPLGRFHPFALAGLGFSNMKVGNAGTIAEQNGLAPGKNGNFAGRFALGVDFYVSPNLVLTADASYVLPRGELNELQYFSVGWGLQWRFDPIEY